MWRAQRSHSPQNLPGDAQLVVFEVFTELAQIVEIGDFFPKLVTKKEKRQKKIEKQKNIRGQERGRVGGGCCGSRLAAGTLEQTALAFFILKKHKCRHHINAEQSGSSTHLADALLSSDLRRTQPAGEPHWQKNQYRPPG